MPVVITETGYRSSNDIKYIANNSKDIAHAIAQGINQYFADKY